jgi:hypothetical protein
MAGNGRTAISAVHFPVEGYESQISTVDATDVDAQALKGKNGGD